MKSIEVTGESVEDAIANGLDELGVGPSEVIVEVLEEGGRGVFGLGTRSARVRLQLLVSSPSIESSLETPESSLVGEVGLDEFSDFASTANDVAAFDSVDADDAEEWDGIEEEDATVGKAVLGELLEKMSVSASITVRRAESTHPGENPPWLLDVSGNNMNLLIGRRGETLSSLQYVTRLITSRRLQRRANIIVDVARYKSRRSERLHNLAVRMADQAIQQNRTVTLEPMPPNERRIVHLALKDRSDVLTKSVGEGDSRKVTIVPR